MLSIATSFRTKGNRSRGQHTCVTALSLGEEGVNSAHGGSKDVGRREAEGRASERKHLLGEQTLASFLPSVLSDLDLTQLNTAVLCGRKRGRRMQRKFCPQSAQERSQEQGLT